MFDRIQDYITTYGEPSSEKIARSVPYGQWDHVFAVPSMGESSLATRFLDSVERVARASKRRLLVLFFINAREGTDRHFQDNQATLEIIRARYGNARLVCTDPPTYFVSGEGVDIVVPYFNEEPHLIPFKEGIGLVRKLINDTAAWLCSTNVVTSGWIHNTDVDVELPSDYLGIYESPGDYCAIIHPYRHLPAGDPNSAKWPILQTYEIWLRYYYLGLKHAGSPYAMHTLGSTISVSAEAYAKVRGVPKRQAGEDFYWLNKLRKVGEIRYERDVGPLNIIERESTRVPFGTGATLAKTHSISEFHFLDPRNFDVLETLLRCMDDFLMGDGQFSVSDVLSVMPIDAELKSVLGSVFTKMGFDDACKRISRSAGDRIRRKNFVDWFDAFKTLKFVHALRDNVFPNVFYRDALTAARFISLDENWSDKQILTLLQTIS
ncbi:MAG: hypothetical protein AB7T49_18590 [Oligoflexales bacterium]